MDIKIQKLNIYSAFETIKLINSIFNKQSVIDKIAVLISCILPDFFIKKILLKKLDYQFLEFYISIDTIKSKVSGVVAIYKLLNDSNNILWIGWLGVKKNYRKMGIGNSLLEYMENKARNEGYKSLKLYSNDIPERIEAMNIYEKRGYKITNIEKGESYNLIFRELNLH